MSLSASPYNSDCRSLLNAPDPQQRIPIRMFLGWRMSFETEQIIHAESFRFQGRCAVCLSLLRVFADVSSSSARVTPGLAARSAPGTSWQVKSRGAPCGCISLVPAANEERCAPLASFSGSSPFSRFRSSPESQHQKSWRHLCSELFAFTLLSSI